MLNMKQAAEKAGIPYETLKFYCREGLVPNIHRDKNNYRLFKSENLIWIKSLQCLKQSGMGISELRHFMHLSLQGEGTLGERKIILNAQKQQLIERKQEIDANIAYIDHKIEHYDSLMSEGTLPKKEMATR